MRKVQRVQFLCVYVNIYVAYVVQITPVWNKPLTLLRNLNHIGNIGLHRFT